MYIKDNLKVNILRTELTNMENQKDLNIKDISLINDPNRWLAYISLKNKKLSQAVYLITSLLPDNEPLKWRLRDSSLGLVSDISFLLELRTLNANLIETISNKIGQLLVWLEVALAGNFISEMNISLLKKEYTGLKELLTSQLKETNLIKVTTLSEEELSKTCLDRNLESEKQLALATNTQLSRNDNSYQKISHLPHKKRDGAKDSRRSLIVNFLKGKDWTSIKDITQAVGGCSSKTIQRELADLVQQRLLEKKGDRRWSRYLLA